MKTDTAENATVEAEATDTDGVSGGDERSEEYWKVRAIGQTLLTAFAKASQEAREENERLAARAR